MDNSNNDWPSLLPDGVFQRQPDGSYVVVRGGTFKWKDGKYHRAVPDLKVEKIFQPNLD